MKYTPGFVFYFIRSVIYIAACVKISRVKGSLWIVRRKLTIWLPECMMTEWVSAF
ncbi:hypothetical protein CM49_02208 [Paenibacillus sp. P1XP2]|nr:hypothetical protein CM49_02208 [Paenibacillus sp. P1XP2]